MGVAVHESRHEHGPTAVDHFITLLWLNTRADRRDFSIRDAQHTRVHPRRIKLNEQRIAKESWHVKKLATENMEKTKAVT